MSYGKLITRFTTGGHDIIPTCRSAGNYYVPISDFGSSNIFYGENSLNTQCGSPVYAAPEVFASKKYGPAVDVWSM